MIKIGLLSIALLGPASAFLLIPPKAASPAHSVGKVSLALERGHRGDVRGGGQETYPPGLEGYFEGCTTFKCCDEGEALCIADANPGPSCNDAWKVCKRNVRKGTGT